MSQPQPTTTTNREDTFPHLPWPNNRTLFHLLGGARPSPATGARLPTLLMASAFILGVAVIPSVATQSVPGLVNADPPSISGSGFDSAVGGAFQPGSICPLEGEWNWYVETIMVIPNIADQMGKKQ